MAGPYTDLPEQSLQQPGRPARRLGQSPGGANPAPGRPEPAPAPASPARDLTLPSVTMPTSRRGKRPGAAGGEAGAADATPRPDRRPDPSSPAETAQEASPTGCSDSSIPPTSISARATPTSGIRPRP